MLSLELPIYWTTPSGKTILTGLNWYRNAHYYLQNQWKQEITELIAKQVTCTKISSPYKTHIQLHYKSSVSDAGNVVALIEKAALDAFQKLGITENDSVKHHVKASWEVISQDRVNPRCIITITSENLL